MKTVSAPTTDTERYANLASPDQSETLRRRLVHEYVERHNAFENWSFSMAALLWVAQGFGRDPFVSFRGRLIVWATMVVTVLGPALAVTAWTETWATAPVARWAFAAAGWALLAGVVFLGWVKGVNRTMLTLHGALAAPESLRRLIAWDRRWFRYDVVAALAVAFVAGAGALYAVLLAATGAAPVHPGTLAFAAVLAYIVGETVGTLILLVAEYPALARERFQLYRPGPFQTVALARALRGYNAFALGISLYLTLTILLAVFLLPSGSALVVPIAGSLLALSYGVSGLVVLAPRVLMAGIARREKERALAPLQAEIDLLWAGLEDLDASTYARYQRLKEKEAQLTNAYTGTFGFVRGLGYVTTSLLLPTLAALLAAALSRMIGA